MNTKMAHCRDKAIMRQVALEVQSGSEERIADEEQWTRQHCRWSESEETGIPSTSRATEESEEEEHDL